MAKHTPVSLRNQVIYSVYVRNHTPEGTFRALEGDLPRIRDLGVDIIWLMPIHPIGAAGRKGSMGCPYANRDYRSVNPEYGTMEDFTHLVDAIHANGMKCIIDVVYNHTSPDSTLRHAHPEFFYRGADGSFGNRFGDWSDVIDLNYENRALWGYQIESLKQWAAIVDGFRCDVASLVPVEFWLEARAACEEIKAGLIWLAETVHKTFNCQARLAGMRISSDSEAYAAFDMEYSYDIRELLDGYWAGERPLHEWVEALCGQECAYPANYIKLRCLENHDQPRIASRVRDPLALRNWHAMMFMLKGTPMLYGGEEYCDEKQPSLFERDTIDRSGRDISEELRGLIALKKRLMPESAAFSAQADDAGHAVYTRCTTPEGRGCVGLFSLQGKPVRMATGLADGMYRNEIDGSDARVAGGMLESDGRPVVIAM